MRDGGGVMTELRSSSVRSLVAEQEASNDKTGRRARSRPRPANLVQPFRRRASLLWLSNAVIKECELEHSPSSEAVIPGMLRSFTPPPLRLDWPMDSQAENEDDVSKRTSSVLQQKRRKPPRRFERQYRPPPYDDGLDEYVPRTLADLGDPMVTVIRRWLGVLRLCFWTMRKPVMRRRPAVDAVTARRASYLAREKLRHWRKKMERDRFVSLRVKFYNRLALQRSFDEMFLFATHVKNCRTIITRFCRARYGQAFYNWRFQVMLANRYDELVQAANEVKLKWAFHAVALHAGARKRVKQRAERWLESMRRVLHRTVRRWRAHTVTAITKYKAIEARFLPLKRRVFQAWKRDVFPHMTATLTKPVKLPPYVIKANRGAEKVADILSRHGRLPPFVSFLEARAPRILSAGTGQPAAHYMDQDLASTSDDSVTSIRIAALDIDEQTMGIREAVVLRTSPTAVSLPRTLEGAQVFNYGHVQIFTDPDELDSLQRMVQQSRHARNAPVQVHFMAGKDGRSVGSGEHDDDDDKEQNAILSAMLQAQAPGEAPKSVVELIQNAIHAKRAAKGQSALHVQSAHGASPLETLKSPKKRV